MKSKKPDESEEFDSEKNANEELEYDAVLARAKGLGLVIPKDAKFTADELNEIVTLADRQPDSDSLHTLSCYGIALSKGTALEARMLANLVEAYSTDRWEDKLPRTALAAVCAVALKDPAVYQVAFNDMSIVYLFQWPESKLEEWVKGAGSSMAAWEKEVQRHPEDAHALWKLGLEYKNAGRLTDAIAVYKRAITLAPNFADPWISLAALYHHSGQFSEAESAFVEGQRANPKSFAGFVKAIKRGPNYAELKQRYPKVFNE